MIALVGAEIAKLRNSLALLLCAAAPALVGGFGAMLLLDKSGDYPWRRLIEESVAMWAFFVLPMTVTALTVLVAQMEHGPRMWNHLLTLPQPRWAVFAAKAAVVMLLTAATSAILVVALLGAAALADWAAPKTALTGAPPILRIVTTVAAICAASFAMAIVQLWAALRFKSFVPPLVLGIAGTFVTLAVAASKPGIFLPWILPVYALAHATPNGEAAVMIGAFGGLALGLAMVADLSRRDHAS